MKIQKPLGEAMLVVRSSYKFIIQQKENRTYRFRRKRLLPEVRVFRMIFPRMMVNAKEKNGQTRFRLGLDGLGIFMFIIFTLALFLPFIPLEEGDEMDIPVYAPYLMFVYYIGFVIFEYRTTKKLLQSILTTDT